MEQVDVFELVREIPYHVPLDLKDKDQSCFGKHEELYKKFKELGLETRYRLAYFYWSKQALPKHLTDLIEEDKCLHLYLEVNINDEWIAVDATWDSGLKDVLPINHWDGQTSTEIAIEPFKILGPNRSQFMMEHKTDEDAEEVMSANPKFYKALNQWVEEARKGNNGVK